MNSTYAWMGCLADRNHVTCMSKIIPAFLPGSSVAQLREGPEGCDATSNFGSFSGRPAKTIGKTVLTYTAQLSSGFIKRNNAQYLTARDCKFGLPDTRNPGYLGLENPARVFPIPDRVFGYLQKRHPNLQAIKNQ